MGATMDGPNPKVWARIEPELRDWVLAHAADRWQENQSAVIREALLLYRGIVDGDLESVVKRLVRQNREAAAA
jgi:hypothetical protein